MVQLVNGFSCHNSADVALAKRGINPVAPKPAGAQSPATPAAATHGQGAAPPADAARFGRGQFVNLIA